MSTKLQTKTKRVFVTSDKKEHDNKDKAIAHQKKLDAQNLITPMVEKMLNAKGAPAFTGEQFDGAVRFGLHLFEQGLLLTKKPAAKAKPAPSAPSAS